MNNLRIILNEDGSVSQFIHDFKVMRGSYRNVLVNIEVPSELLFDAVTDEEGNGVTGNNVRIGAVIRTLAGRTLRTQRYECQRIKEFIRGGKKFSLYQRRMPKEFTMWETSEESEDEYNDLLNMIVNVVNWVVDDSSVKVETIATSQTVSMDIYPSAFLGDAEEIEEPTDFDQLQSQVQDISSELEEFQNQITTNATNISSNASEIFELKAQVSVNTSDIRLLTDGVSLSDYYTKTEVDALLGDVSSALDIINGEEVTK